MYELYQLLDFTVVVTGNNGNILLAHHSDFVCLMHLYCSSIIIILRTLAFALASLELTAASCIVASLTDVVSLSLYLFSFLTFTVCATLE